jgi:hypothetical protein
MLLNGASHNGVPADTSNMNQQRQIQFNRVKINKSYRLDRDRVSNSLAEKIINRLISNSIILATLTLENNSNTTRGRNTKRMDCKMKKKTIGTMHLQLTMSKIHRLSHYSNRKKN